MNDHSLTPQAEVVARLRNRMSSARFMMSIKDFGIAVEANDISFILNALDSATAREAELSVAMEDVGRYRALRMMDWFNGPLCVVRNPKRFFCQPLALGTDCPSRDRLDAAIDAVRAGVVTVKAGEI